MATREEAASVVVLLSHLKAKKNKKREHCVKPWMSSRAEKGAHNNIIRELRFTDPASYRNYLRLSQDQYDELLEMIRPAITKQDTVMRQALSPEEMLSVTMRFLATGESYKSLQYDHRISRQSICKFVPRVCWAIYNSLKEKYMKVPDTELEWRNISEEFYRLWNFPNCLGALDGKHVVLQMPANSGATYFNYKKTFSIVLLALVDAQYRFICVDVGCNGRISDGGVFRNSILYHAMEDGTLAVPPPCPLPGMSEKVPYFFVADEAFSLKTYLMKPFAQRGLTAEKRIFNYRLSRARRVVENAFGILANRFRVFRSALSVSPESAESIVMACCALHNYLRMNTLLAGTSDIHPELEQTNPGSESSEGMLNISNQGSNNHTKDAGRIRDILMEYVNGCGSVDWQERCS